MSVSAAFFLHAVLCTDASRDQCDPPEFMYAPEATAPAAVRATACAQLADAMNLVQLDKSVYYVCSASKGGVSERS